MEVYTYLYMEVIFCSIFDVPAFGLQPDIESLEENFLLW